MNPLALALILVSVMAMAVGSNWSRWLMRARGFHELEPLVIRCGVGGVVACLLPYVLFHSYWQGLNADSSDLTLFWVSVAGTTTVNAVILYVNMRAYKMADVSFTAPISAMTPGLVTMATLFLGEKPSVAGWIGIGMIMVGTYLHAREGAGWREYFQPLFIWRAFGSLEGLSDEVKRKRLGNRG